MLGCHDFCGYYDWTFHFIRREFGEAAVQSLWADAIGQDSQRHYIELGLREGLKGLFEAWRQTGEDEQCDWTFTLDAKSNVLRWDMRKCPSKGFLLAHDLNADEDYCDHCMGWESSMLGSLGLRMIRHEHNHSGQCWGEMTLAGTEPAELTLEADIRKDPRWQTGFVERFDRHIKLPVLGQPGGQSDWVAVLAGAMAGERLVILGRGPSVRDLPSAAQSGSRLLVTGSAYASGEQWWKSPDVVLVNSPVDDTLLAGISARYSQAGSEHRPLLAYAYLPSQPPVAFPNYGLPRPVPILPALIRANLYVHDPRGPFPTTGVFLALLGAAVSNAREVHIAGIDGYAHPSGVTYAHGVGPADATWQPEHSPEVDQSALARVGAHLGSRLCFLGSGPMRDRPESQP